MIKKVATDSPCKERGGRWVIAQTCLMLAVAVLGVTERHGFEPWPLQMPVAIGLFAVSAYTGVAGVLALGKSRTAYPKPLESSRLVRHGVYAHLRHPLYSSVLCWALSWSLFWCSGFALAASLLLAPFFDAKARREERWLRARYPDYAAYERRVRRFIPGIY